MGRVKDRAHVGNVLRALVVDAADAVVEKQHGKLAIAFAVNVANVEQHAVDDAPGLNEEFAPCALQFLGRGPFARHQPEAKHGKPGDCAEATSQLPFSCSKEDHLRRNPPQGCLSKG